MFTDMPSLHSFLYKQGNRDKSSKVKLKQPNKFLQFLHKISVNILLQKINAILIHNDGCFCTQTIETMITFDLIDDRRCV